MDRRPEVPVYSLFRHQVSGKAPKLITSDKKMILKCYIKSEFDFYNYFNSCVYPTKPEYSLLRYLPKFGGSIIFDKKPEIEYQAEGDNKEISIWLQHVKIRYEKKNEDNRFILLQNFLHDVPKPNVLDIKIGGRSNKPQKVTKAVAEYKIKLNGFFKTLQNGESQFLSKYILNQINELSQLKKYIAYFFTSKNKLQLGQIKHMIQELKNLVLAVRSARGWKFSSSSVCFTYDTDCINHSRLNYIDFGRAFQVFEDTYDDEVSAGLQNIVKIMMSICNQSEKYENIVIQKSDKDVVPKQKIMKFGSHEKLNEEN